MKMLFAVLVLLTTILFPTPTKACEDGGLTIMTAVVEKMVKGENGLVEASTGKDANGRRWLVNLIPQRRENFDEMVKMYLNQEIAIGYVGEGDSVEVVWAVLTSYD